VHASFTAGFAYQSSPSGGQSASSRGLITVRSFFVHRKITMDSGGVFESVLQRSWDRELSRKRAAVSVKHGTVRDN
jgi:hypothetical protein